MSYNDHDHRGEYAADNHSHDSYDVYGVAKEHHDHDRGELWSYIHGLREDLGAAEIRIADLEKQVTALALGLAQR